MAEERNFGSDVQGAEETLAKLQQLQDEVGALEQRERGLRSTEVGTTTAIDLNSSALQRAIEETGRLSAITTELTSSLRRETDALLANTTAWARRSSAMTGAGVEPMVVGAASPRRAPRAARAAAAEAAVANEQLAFDMAAVRPRVGHQPAYVSPIDTRTQMSFLDPGYQYETGRMHGPERLLRPPGSTPAPIFGSVEHGPQTALQAQAQAADAAAAAQARLRAEEQASVAQAAELRAEQLRVNQAYQQSVAVYAESSTALSRNGALTTEFIQAFARGDSTLKEFQSQMVSTIGKFGGWAVAGGLVYGAYDAIKKLGQGMTETQAGVQQLSRFIPTAGTSQRGQTEQTFRNLSLGLNVPISEVTSSMAVMARTFHDVADAGNAAKAALLATRLDNITPAQSEQYFTGIAQSFGFTNGPGGGQKLLGVINSLNALQNNWAARVSQTLPALAVAAPAATAAGLQTTGGALGTQSGISLLEALVGVGVRSGISGPQVGTALVRAMNGSQEFTGVNLANLQQLGLNPQRGQFGNLINEIVGRQTGRADRRFSEDQIRQIAQDIGGTRMGPRVLLPILQHAALLPGIVNTAEHPPQTAQEELSHVLGSTSEEFKHIGIVIENLGSELESAGLTSALQVALKAIDEFGNALTIAAKPVGSIATAYGQLPGVVKDIVGVGVGYGGLRALQRSSLGFTSQRFIGRLPGLASLAPDEREQAIRDKAGDLRTLWLPEQKRNEESARMRAARAHESSASATEASIAAQAEYNAAPTAAGAGVVTEAKARAEAAAEKAAALDEEANVAAQRTLRMEALIAELLNTRATAEGRMQVAVANGVLLEGEMNESRAALLVQMRKQLVAEATTARVSGVAAIGAGASYGGTGAGALGAATAGAVATRAFQNAPAEEQAAVIAAGVSMESPQAMQEALAGGAIATAEQQSRLGLAARLGAGTRSAGGLLRNPLGLLIGSQIAGGIVGGPVGGGINEAGLALGGGALAAKFLLPKIGSILEKGYGVEGAVGALGEAGAGTLGVAGLGLAGQAYGATHKGTKGWLASVGGAALTGAAIGTATDEFTFGLGTLVGGLAGGAIGGVEHLASGMFSGGPSSREKQNAAINALGRKLAQAATPGLGSIANGTGLSGSQLSQFSSVFNDELKSAFQNPDTQDAQKAQLQVNRAVENNVELLTAAGTSTGLGRSAADILEKAIGGVAVSKTVRQDPYDTGLIIDRASQGLLTGIGAKFTAQTSLSSGVGSDALSSAISATNTSYRNAIGATIKRLTARADELGVEVAHERRSDTLIAPLQAAKAKLAQASALGSHVHTVDVEQLASQTQTVIGNITTQASGLASLAGALAGGNQLAQAQAQVHYANLALSEITAQQDKLRAAGHPQAANSFQIRNERRQQVTTRASAETQGTQVRAARLQAQLQAEAALVPSDDTVNQAQRAVKDAAAYYSYLLAHSHAFDPSQISQALGALNQAQTQLGVALRAQTQQRFQITETQQTGDPLAAAYTQEAAALKAEAQAKGSGERLAAQEQYAQAVQAVHQATAQQITDIGGLKASESNKTLVQDIAKQSAAWKALKAAVTGGYGKGAIRTALTNYNESKLQTFNDYVNQEEATIQYMQATLQTSAEGALTKLEQLYKHKNLSTSERQQISEQMYQIETDQNNTSLFDLMPKGANIRVPTIFDIRSAVARTRHDIGGHAGHVTIGGSQINTTAGSLNTYDTKVEAAIKDLGAKLTGTNGGRGNVTFNFEVKNAGDVPKVAAAIDRVMGTAVKSRLKSARMR